MISHDSDEGVLVLLFPCPCVGGKHDIRAKFRFINCKSLEYLEGHDLFLDAEVDFVLVFGMSGGQQDNLMLLKVVH